MSSTAEIATSQADKAREDFLQLSVKISSVLALKDQVLPGMYRFSSTLAEEVEEGLEQVILDLWDRITKVKEDFGCQYPSVSSELGSAPLEEVCGETTTESVPETVNLPDEAFRLTDSMSCALGTRSGDEAPSV